MRHRMRSGQPSAMSVTSYPSGTAVRRRNPARWRIETGDVRKWRRNPRADIDIDDRLRRLAYAVVDWRTTHHNASFQVFAAGKSRSRIVWIADLLPDDLADLVNGMMDQGCAAMRRTLEADNGDDERIN
jgi:hypothetical protein